MEFNKISLKKCLDLVEASRKMVFDKRIPPIEKCDSPLSRNRLVLKGVLSAGARNGCFNSGQYNFIKNALPYYQRIVDANKQIDETPFLRESGVSLVSDALTISENICYKSSPRDRLLFLLRKRQETLAQNDVYFEQFYFHPVEKVIRRIESEYDSCVQLRHELNSWRERLPCS
ncbi:hypothetical protein FJZ18_00475 [Candidatus Pacearchaeota archaeon]|nr:hypothetical protein [Candidatus Pacearchaeota archaeon]